MKIGNIMLNKSCLCVLIGLLSISKQTIALSAGWEALGGESGMEPHELTPFVSLAISPLTHTPYLVYDGSLSFALMQTYDKKSKSWNIMGPLDTGVNGMWVSFTRIAFGPSDNPYVAFTDLLHHNGAASVMQYDSSSGIYSYLGESGFTHSPVVSIRLNGNAYENNQPYLAYLDNYKANRVSVAKYDSKAKQWKFVGESGFTDINISQVFVNLHPVTHEPWVIFTDLNNPSSNGSAGSNKISIMKYDSAAESWSYVPERGIAGSQNANIVRLAFNPKTLEPYIGYNNYLNSSRLDVMRFDGRSWVLVGESGISTGPINYNGSGDLSLSFNPNTAEPYVAYPDMLDAGRVTVKRFHEGKWIVVGSPSFSCANPKPETWGAWDSGIYYLAYPCSGSDSPALGAVVVKNIESDL